jgi:hypothetical protein
MTADTSQSLRASFRSCFLVVLVHSEDPIGGIWLTCTIVLARATTIMVTEEKLVHVSGAGPGGLATALTWCMSQPVLMLALSIITSGTLAEAQPGRISAGELVKRTVANELRAANAPGHYMYQMRIQKARDTQLKEMVETKDWLIGRLIQFNGKPLTTKQERKEEERLARLLDDESLRRQENKDQQENERQMRDLLRALPGAFLYEYVDPEPGETPSTVEHLRFEPNPQFHAPSRRLEVLQGMRGTMRIDGAAERLVRLQGELFRSVDFGWGILARLDPGGRLLLEQRDVGNGRWAIAKLSLYFTGKLLLFKTLKIDTTIETSDFRRMRDDLTLLEGLELLKNRNEMTR